MTIPETIDKWEEFKKWWYGLSDVYMDHVTQYGLEYEIDRKIEEIDNDNTKDD